MSQEAIGLLETRGLVGLVSGTDAMLKAAGWGVAVANAHPDTLQAADEVTDSNIDNGVAKVLEEMLELS